MLKALLKRRGKKDFSLRLDYKTTAARGYFPHGPLGGGVFGYGAPMGPVGGAYGP